MVAWLDNVAGWLLDPIMVGLATIGVVGWLIETCRSDRRD